VIHELVLHVTIIVNLRLQPRQASLTTRHLLSRTPRNTMSAQHIPNLLTLRGGGRPRGGRGRGRGCTGASDHGVLAASRKDLDIQSTDTDAAVSRLSAVSLEYLNDQFARFFVNGIGTRRLPIINRGWSAISTSISKSIVRSPSNARLAQAPIPARLPLISS